LLGKRPNKVCAENQLLRLVFLSLNLSFKRSESLGNLFSTPRDKSFFCASEKRLLGALSWIPAFFLL
jgi:hypothetical protein